MKPILISSEGNVPYDLLGSNKARPFRISIFPTIAILGTKLPTQGSFRDMLKPYPAHSNDFPQRWGSGAVVFCSYLTLLAFCDFLRRNLQISTTSITREFGGRSIEFQVSGPEI